MSQIDFKEVQRFRVWWAWLGVIILNLFFIYAIVQQLLFGIPFGSKPASNITLLLIELGPLLLVVFLLSIRLHTHINETGIYYRFFPFQINTVCIGWDQVNKADLRRYNSFYEYGGWGIRVGSPEKGNAINTSESCNEGLQLQFTNGRLLLIGTRHPDALREVIELVKVKGLLQMSHG
jgi:hypothetical protein